MIPGEPSPTYSVSALCAELQEFLAAAYPAVWVAGEAQRVRRSQRGHLYLELVEKGAGDGIEAKLDAVIWRTDYERIARQLAASGQRLDEGVELRCRGGIDFYPPGGRLQLVIREVDPVFTLGLVERRRRELLAELAAAGLLERNRELALPLLPLRLALITSAGSAAYHDFLSTLVESGYGFEVLLLHTAVQGKTAEVEVASALAALPGLGVDCAVLVRGGGARTDLAAFDSRAIALAIANAAVPVITGLGHETDESIADRVAHTAVKTPTKAAELLVGRVAAAELALRERGQALRRAALEPLRRADQRLAQVERRALVASLRVTSLGRQLETLHRRLATAARGQLQAARGYLAGLERLCAELAPERTLERGFSITRDERGGVVRSPEAVKKGELLLTQTAGGLLASRVEAR